MANYFALVEQDDDSAFGVSFPDIPGCFSASDDAETVRANAIQALELHLENAVAPQPRSLLELKYDEDVRSALRQGAFLMSVPYIQNARRAVRINISLDAGTLEAIDGAAQTRGLTRSAFIAEAAAKEIKDS